MKLNKRSAAYGALLLTVVNLFSQLIAFFYRIILSRLIGAEGMGLFQLVFPVYNMVMSITVSGLTVAVSRMSAEFAAGNRRPAIRRLLRSAISIFISLFTPLAVFVILASDFIANELLGDARTQMGLMLLLPCILFTGLENLHKNYFYGTKNVTPPAVSEIVEQLVRTGTVLALLVLFKPKYEEYAVALIVAGMGVCEIFSAGLLRWFYRRDAGARREEEALPSKVPTVRQILAISVPVGLTSLLGTLIGSVNAIMIPGRLAASGLLHSEALRQYGVMFGMTMQLLGLPNVFLVSLSLVMVPRLAESNALGAEERLGLRIKKTMMTASFFTFGAMSLLAAVGAPITVALFDQPSAGQYFGLLTLGAALGCFQLISSNLLNGIGYQNRAACYVLLGDGVQLLLTWLLVARPELRLEGFAWAAVIGAGLTLLLNLICLFRKTGFRYPPGRGLLLPAGAAWAAYNVSSLLSRVLPGDQGVLPCVVAMILGAVTYLCLLTLPSYLKKLT